MERGPKNLNLFFKKGKTMMLAYDQGLEHGPSDFNDKNIDPLFIIDIAKKGKYNAVIFQKGIAEKYNKEIKKAGVPLIVKLNGKTSLYKGEPMSRQLCSVEEAIMLGAKGVGYTIYIGSRNESDMLSEFEKIQEEAHKKGLAVVAWIYPRGKDVRNENNPDLMIYACRVGLEIGADIIKIRYCGNKDDLARAVRAAGRARVVIAGGAKKDRKEFLGQTKEIIDVGATGLAVGRNVWQDSDPINISNQIKKVIWK
ncbi:MAG: fructose-bisphosphate aldolase [Candidatus Pacearchaeota archaeon]